MENIKKRNSKDESSNGKRRSINATDLLGIVVAILFISRIDFKEVSGLE